MKTLREVENEHIVKLLIYFEGNIQKAAYILGIGRDVLYRRIRSEEISKELLDARISKKEYYRESDGDPIIGDSAFIASLNTGN